MDLTGWALDRVLLHDGVLGVQMMVLWTLAGFSLSGGGGVDGGVDEDDAMGTFCVNFCKVVG